MKCHDEPENHKFLYDHGTVTLSTQEIDIAAIKKINGKDWLTSYTSMSEIYVFSTYHLLDRKFEDDQKRFGVYKVLSVWW